MPLKIAATALALALAAPAYAEEACAPRTDLIAKLADKYGETLHGRGILPDGRLYELFSSDKTGTWTVLVTEPSDLVACFAASGEMWDGAAEAPAAPAKGEPA